MNNLESLIEFLDTCIEKNNKYNDMATICEVDTQLFYSVDSYFQRIKLLLLNINELKDNYKQQIRTDSVNIVNHFSVSISTISQDLKHFYKDYFINELEGFSRKIHIANFNLNIFEKFHFFDKNIVAIGANGSGKSTLSSKLKEYLPDTTITISAQKILIFPVFDSIENPNKTRFELTNSQTYNKIMNFETKNLLRHSELMNVIEDEFTILLKNLLSENNALNNQYVRAKRIGINIKLPVTNLIKAIEIWNQLIEHRTLECDDGINISLKADISEISYPAYQMSDGEKIVLYYVAHILQAPKNGFVIVDEPEMYLHKTLLNKLWDILETEREDCIFIYLTHDLEFATSRNNAKKVWIKSFTHPDIWEMEDIPTNDLPEDLLLKLLGSRKNILFCESEKGKIDDRIYNILLPNYTITPVTSCFDVINYTKAFNQLPNINIKAYGLIDSDHHDEKRLHALKENNVFALHVSEVENLLFDEDFLKAFAIQMMVDESVVSQIKKEVIKQLTEKKELQIANYVSAKINNTFKGSHVRKGNTEVEVKNHFEDFTKAIKIEEWFETRGNELQEIIDNEDYEKSLLVNNDKGLQRIANKNFNIGNFQERAITFLQFNKDTHQYLCDYLPSEVLENE